MIVLVYWKAGAHMEYALYPHAGLESGEINAVNVSRGVQSFGCAFGRRIDPK